MCFYDGFPVRRVGKAEYGSLLFVKPVLPEIDAIFPLHLEVLRVRLGNVLQFDPLHVLVYV